LCFDHFAVTVSGDFGLMDEAKYLVGIDLGTSNCAMAYVELARGADAPVIDFPIPQLVRPGEIATLDLLPSCIYLPAAHETFPQDQNPTGPNDSSGIVGEFARWQGARVPGRLVVSAKSWLCHPAVDRQAPILPWGALEDVERVSPVQASARLLTHMVRAWNAARPAEPLQDQDVVITVPASFDEVARSLTVQAANAAGLAKFTLVEEPQAAFYDFTARNRKRLEDVLEGFRLILVVDVGGGTSDFTLVQCSASGDGPVLRRIAVGEHLMLGGDNMDAALSRVIEERMVGSARRLSMTQWTQLTQSARVAKEALLSTVRKKARSHKAGAPAPAADHFNVSLISEGSRLVGTTLSAQITRTEAERVVLDGFFPKANSEAIPARTSRAALQEVGLPYAQDPAITRHLAAFLRAHAAAAKAALGQPADSPGLPRPDSILLNGGVFNSNPITRRLLEVVSSWWPSAGEIPLLAHDSLDLAVARGAAFYGLARRGLGRRIGGGSAHALFVGLEKAGSEQPMALCVVPRGQEEAEPIDLGSRVFQLSLGRPVRFPLYSTASDRSENAGDVIAITEDLKPLPAIHTLLKGSGTNSSSVPVHLQAMLTPIGTLELWCVANHNDHRWRLEFELRGNATERELSITESMPAAFAEARSCVEKMFGAKSRAGHGAGENRLNPAKEVKQLWTRLEQILGSREQWGLPVLREVWSVLFASAARRRRTPEHERIFFQLLGYTLRPGFGYALDEWRCEQCAALFSESVQFHSEKAVWKEFWVFWRRIAGGLSPARHEELWAYLRPFLAVAVPPRPQKHVSRPKGIQPDGVDEMARLAAALEHLSFQTKIELGDWIAARLTHPEKANGPWTWSLGRLGSRAPIYGSLHQIVPPEKASQWVRLLLEPGIVRLEGALFALTQLARLTGDRTRDLDEALRLEVAKALQQANASPSWQRMITEMVPLEAADKARALGDTLPVGLILT
jgi:molecular chaperone DnaK (HSP70)